VLRANKASDQGIGIDRFRDVRELRLDRMRCSHFGTMVRQAREGDLPGLQLNAHWEGGFA
jgi:hypothetical protein